MQPSNQPSFSFTIKSNTGILKVLVTPVTVFIPGKNSINVQAIWDTGATGSAITTKTVRDLGLTPTGMAQVHTANGMAQQNTYTIDVRLPNGVLIQGIIATEVAGLSSGCDALIGMDVITLGDFAITNHKGVTCMSFRVPSCHEVDYVKNQTYGVTPIKLPPGSSGSNITPPKKKRKR